MPKRMLIYGCLREGGLAILVSSPGLVCGRFHRATSPQHRDNFQLLSTSTVQANYDEHAVLIQNYAFVGDMALYIAVNSLEYTKPVAYPLVFQPFTEIQPHEPGACVLHRVEEVVALAW